MVGVAPVQAQIPSCPVQQPDELDRLHTVYDGRPPRRMRLAALVGGDDVLARLQEAAQASRLRTQCAGVLLAVARRRRQLSAMAADDDAWLCRLTAAMAAARTEAASHLPRKA